MSREAVLSFFKAASQDRTLRQVLGETVTAPEDFVEVARTNGFEFTREDLATALLPINEQLNRLEIPPGMGSSSAFIEELLRLLHEIGTI
ncbi:MAG: Nif11-like leader peptide family natural product precursor [Cyanobacteria bacterium SID2]|nr:Nif11-like leader peptide family natural product precursor [Cyanobacteria bacterium SID2]MBP0003934.1 Nif11-like leader peptide family natural product precursor [Cyanobacteria bacterium SBC]